MTNWEFSHNRNNQEKFEIWTKKSALFRPCDNIMLLLKVYKCHVRAIFIASGWPTYSAVDVERIGPQIERVRIVIFIYDSKIQQAAIWILKCKLFAPSPISSDDKIVWFLSWATSDLRAIIILYHIVWPIASCWYQQPGLHVNFVLQPSYEFMIKNYISMPTENDRLSSLGYWTSRPNLSRQQFPIHRHRFYSKMFSAE